VYEQSYESLAILFYDHVTKFNTSQELAWENDHCSHAASFSAKKYHLNSASCLSLLTRDFDLIQIGEQNRHIKV